MEMDKTIIKSIVEKIAYGRDHIMVKADSAIFTDDDGNEQYYKYISLKEAEELIKLYNSRFMHAKKENMRITKNWIHLYD